MVSSSHRFVSMKKIVIVVFGCAGVFLEAAQNNERAIVPVTREQAIVVDGERIPFLDITESQEGGSNCRTHLLNGVTIEGICALFACLKHAQGGFSDLRRESSLALAVNKILFVQKRSYGFSPRIRRNDAGMDALRRRLALLRDVPVRKFPLAPKD